MKKVIFLVVFMLILNFRFAQVAKADNYYADTVRIELNNGAMIELCGADLTKHFPEKFEINKKLSDFLYYWDKLKIEDLSPNKRMLIRFDWTNIVLTEVSKSDCYTISRMDSAVIYPNKGHILELNNRVYTKVRIFFSDFSQLKEIELLNTERMFANLNEDIKKEQNRHVRIGPRNIAIIKWYKLTENNTLKKIFETPSIRTPYGNDELGLHIGTNIQNLKGVWAGSIFAKMDLIYGRKMVLKNKYSFQYDWVYDFSSQEQGFQKHVNHFAGIGYSRNFSNNPNNSSWYGISASYLVKRNGDFFNKNTFAIGLSRSFDSRFEIQPMIYFNDFFKNAYPSLKIGVSF
jgi:hypothetical protein